MKIKDIFLFLCNEFDTSLDLEYTISLWQTCQIYWWKNVCDFAGKIDLIAKWISCASIFHVLCSYFLVLIYLFCKVEKYTHMIELMLAAHQPVLITGMPGVGKTSLLQVKQWEKERKVELNHKKLQRANLLGFSFIAILTICNCYKYLSTTHFV